jgi:tetratricopeptide (TPR) repeat protein
MSSIPPKSESPQKGEGKRRPVSVLAVKLWETAETLEQRLDDPTEILEMLVSALAKGEEPGDVWERLHEAARRHDRLADLAFSYEHVVADKRIKLLPPEQQAFVFHKAAQFCADYFGDADGAIKYAERATHAIPGHPEAFALLERLLSSEGKAGRLGELYVDASTREDAAERKLALLRRAAQLFSDAPEADELAIDVGQRILKITPGDEAAREALVRRLLARGRHKDVVDVFEQALRGDPPQSEAVMLRELLVDLCFNELRDAQRALFHIEGLLSLVPTHPTALKSAESLLENRALSLRAAAALSDAYEKSGRIESAIGMLSFELKQVRGPRRVEVQRRLAILRQDALNDAAGALELLGPVVAGDPGDDALRQRFVALSLSLNQPEQAARLLSRALQTNRDLAVRARVGVDVGHVYLKVGDLKRAQQAFQHALDSGHDDGAVLEAARQLADLYAEGDTKQLLSVLETVVRLEPEKESRQAAARRLARSWPTTR